jgi:hypothetical protein
VISNTLEQISSKESAYELVTIFWLVVHVVGRGWGDPPQLPNPTEGIGDWRKTFTVSPYMKMANKNVVVRTS